MNTPIKTSLKRRFVRSAFSLSVFGCFAYSPLAQAVVPAPDGGYPGGNTAEGKNALFSLTTGGFNTAVGFLSLRSDTTASFNTALGAGTLLANTADANTAAGAGALLSNTTGFQNTADGALALFSNIDGDFNTANGFRALFSNTTASENTASGFAALHDNTTGAANTAIGAQALISNTEGNGNTAIGGFALGSNTTGSANTAVGGAAGSGLTGSGNVCIGSGVGGDPGVNDTTWIRNVYESVAVARIVYVNQDNKIGTLASTRRVKDDIKPMDKASETIFALKPVSFRYKKEIDRYRAPQFGLVAEDVARVNSDLVTQDKNGEPETVRYEAINAMLLNEFLKEHATVEQLRKEIAVLNAVVKEQAAQIQNVSARIEVSKAAPQLARSDR
jgi:trimeric autotransporter adhesin